MEIFFMLSRRLRPLQAKHPPRLLIAGTRTIVILRQRIVFRFGLFHRRLRVLYPLLRRQSNLLPVLSPSLHVRREVLQIFVHLVQRQRELNAIV